MNPVLLILLGIIVVSIITLIIAIVVRRMIAVPSGNVVYADSENEAGEILKSSEIPLVGKPDYIIEREGIHIPVEVKTGKTPQAPYKNHIAQLFAYCYLLEEKFHKRPPYGIIRYPDREVPLEYSRGAEEGLKTIINEMLKKKRSDNIRATMVHLCKNCAEGLHNRVEKT